jgi:hypothetical protein
MAFERRPQTRFSGTFVGAIVFSVIFQPWKELLKNWWGFHAPQAAISQSSSPAKVLVVSLKL